ncbi:MAG: GLPGLI family protein, partial [Mucilaginibacter sp.]
KNNMMKKTVILYFGLLFLSTTIFAQHAHFTTSGTIEFEKKVNIYAMIKKEINKDNEAFYTPMFEQYQKNNPQFKTLKSKLSFADNKTLFTPGEDDGSNNGFFGDSPLTGQTNTIFTDLAGNIETAQKKVFEETYLVTDTARKISWKITDETREIAGYTCRRANAIIMDSIYVVAFYTTQIPVSGGPESFTGLPGMILGVALPHENLSWFATKVTDTSVPPNTVVPPKKGKPMDHKKFVQTVHGFTKDWGTWGQSYVKGFML